MPALPPDIQKRVDRLNESFRAVLGEFDRQQRWRNAAGVAAFGTALCVLDACIAAEECVEPFVTQADRRVTARLREIALARDVLAPFLEHAAPASAPTAESPE